jgi:4-hydroxy-tetrahydrodipicolinate synthase
MNANFLESNPIPVKAVLSMMGLMTETYRLPMVPMTPANRVTIQKIAEGMGLLKTVEAAQ